MFAPPARGEDGRVKKRNTSNTTHAKAPPVSVDRAGWRLFPPHMFVWLAPHGERPWERRLPRHPSLVAVVDGGDVFSGSHRSSAAMCIVMPYC